MSKPHCNDPLCTECGKRRLDAQIERGVEQAQNRDRLARVEERVHRIEASYAAKGDQMLSVSPTPPLPQWIADIGEGMELTRRQIQAEQDEAILGIPYPADLPRRLPSFGQD